MPYVIIHTLTSLDGRIHAIDLPEFHSAALQYERLALHADEQVFNVNGYLRAPRNQPAQCPQQ
jgi:riboflavin biosynthesis pyrimidine reductase